MPDMPPFTILPLSNLRGAQIADLVLPIQQQEFNVPITLAAQPDLLDVEHYYFRNGGHFWGAFTTEPGLSREPAIADPSPHDARPARQAGQLIGTIALISIGHNAGALRKMFVRKEFRGKDLSVAQHLLNTLLDYCKSKGISDIYLGTMHNMKAAHRFYERNGFAAIDKGDLPNYYPNMPVDNKYYHLTIHKLALS